MKPNGSDGFWFGWLLSYIVRESHARPAFSASSRKRLSSAGTRFFYYHRLSLLTTNFFSASLKEDS